ncbi:MAG: hypothetical protein JSV34_05940 [Candidatus Omnitrophota bacterium]|nr:MAG: hypothetical protein JSV34_05940 [Candidatus Omnitrophota bacterium]
MRRLLVFVICISALVLVCGCAAMRDVATGTGQALKNTGRGTVAVAAGAGKGFLYGLGEIGKVILKVPEATWKGIKKADEWIKENAW